MGQDNSSRAGSRVLGKLGVRGRLFALAIGLAVLGAVCVVVALTGLIDQGNKVRSVDTTFKDFRAERDSYEGWLTSDDQMNMYVALAVLNDPAQRQLLNTTWGQVVSGHAEAIAGLSWLAAHADDAGIRSAASAGRAGRSRRRLAPRSPT